LVRSAHEKGVYIILIQFYFGGVFVASGIVLYRKPIPINNELYNLELPELKANKQSLVLSQRKSHTKALAKSCGAVAVSNSWILNSIAACKLHLETKF
ncbi:protein breast cancer susceptibility 1, partial [Tanacetum coccineum]